MERKRRSKKHLHHHANGAGKEAHQRTALTPVTPPGGDNNNHPILKRGRDSGSDNEDNDYDEIFQWKIGRTKRNLA